MEQPVGHWWLLPGFRGSGIGGELPGVCAALQPEEEKRHVAAGVCLSAGLRRPGSGPRAAGKTTGEARGKVGSSS